LRLRGTGRKGNGEGTGGISLNDPKLFINRELSWISFNDRVLEEANDRSHPLLERVKFLAICGSNLDEFFMTRVSQMQKKINRGIKETGPDGLGAFDELQTTRKAIIPLLEGHVACWREGLLPELAKKCIYLRRLGDLDENQQTILREYFKGTILPNIENPVEDFLHEFIPNLRLNLFVVAREGQKEKYFLVDVPNDRFKRLIEVPLEDKTSKNEGNIEKAMELVFLEDLVVQNLDLLLPDMDLLAAYLFRLTRDAEIEILVDEGSDFLQTMHRSLEHRRTGAPSRLEVDSLMPENVREVLANMFGLPTYLVYDLRGPLGLVDFWQLLKIDRPDLKDSAFHRFVPEELKPDKNLFDEIAKRDYVFYYPYDSFEIILNLLRQAAQDPDVVSICLTLYRIDEKSPLIDVLVDAARHGKKVTTIVELKAKFDEAHNILVTDELKKAGVNVVYNFPKLKIHAKLCFVTRREGKSIVRYSNIGTGNYNAVTTRIYGDISYLTANPKIGIEISNLFDLLSGASPKEDYKYLLVAPSDLKNEILKRIEREIMCHERSENGYLAFKLNGLVDEDIIQALYRASMVGVKVDLNVRGLCCLRPGIKGVSENIRVISIVGRFLEHARLYYFRNDGDEELLLGSADMMPRNLTRRVEVLFVVPDHRLKRSILEYMLKAHLSDNVKARRLLPDGGYERIIPNKDEPKLNSQAWLIENKGIWHGFT
jgi:polyphosphate kinase